MKESKGLSSLKGKIEKETFTSTWKEIFPFYKERFYFEILDGEDLIEIATDMASDNVEKIEKRLAEGKMILLDKNRANSLDLSAIYRFIVVRPYILLQTGQGISLNEEQNQKALDNLLSFPE